MCKFFLERIMNGVGEECYKIVDWVGILESNRLPKEYFDNKPYFQLANAWDNKSSITAYFVSLSAFKEYYFYKGVLIPKPEWENQILPALKQAGERLSKILKEKRENIDKKQFIKELENLTYGEFFSENLYELASYISTNFPEETPRKDGVFPCYPEILVIALRLLKKYKELKVRPNINLNIPEKLLREFYMDCFIRKHSVSDSKSIIDTLKKSFWSGKEKKEDKTILCWPSREYQERTMFNQVITLSSFLEKEFPDKFKKNFDKSIIGGNIIPTAVGLLKQYKYKELKDREEYSDLKRLAKFILDEFPDIKLNHFNNVVDLAIGLLKQYKLTQERPIIWTTNPDEELPTECYIARDLYLIKKEIKSSWSGKLTITI